jgi:iron(III) transport system permease protein
MTKHGRLQIWPAADADKVFVFVVVSSAAALLLLFVLAPIWAILKYSVVMPDGTFGFGNYTNYIVSARFLGILRNTFEVTIAVTGFTVVLAYGFAYAIERTCMPLKPVLRMIALIPIFSPSLVQALGLQFLLGRNGLINRTFGTEVDIYGFWGIFIADTLYAFPHAFLILATALAVSDARLHESATCLGASAARVFWTVTLPATRYGVASAIFVVFTIVITDFGNPVVIGGNYSVLAVEIYNQVSGQANFTMGAVVGVILLLPAALAVFAEKRIARRQFANLSAQSVPLVPRRARVRDACAFVYSCSIALVFLIVVGVVLYASFVRLWPYNLSFTLHHYQFDVQNGIAPLWTSIYVAVITAVLAMVFVTAAAYANHQIQSRSMRLFYFLAVLPAAVPGMVLGLGYVLAFNDPSNPVYTIYGTVVLIAICNLYHYHAQGFLLATTSLKQISRTFDEASATLGASRLTTFRRVTLPLIWPTVISVGVFYFMRAMVTLSAVIFLITPTTQLAAVSVLYLDDRGALNQAAAFAVCIMATVLGFLMMAYLIMRIVGVRAVTLLR